MPPKKLKKDTAVRNERRTVVGFVTNDKMDKTITVRIERLVQHPQFGKVLRKHDVCYAHDEKEEAGRGDRVEIMETRPLSKKKNWRLLRVLEKAAVMPERDAREAARPSTPQPASARASADKPAVSLPASTT